MCSKTTLLLFALATWVGGAGAAATAASLADCNAQATWRVLQDEAQGLPAQAHAVWRDARRLRWPGAPAAAHMRLHASASGQLQARVGQAVGGSDASVALQREADELALPSAWQPRLAGLLRQQLLLVAEDESGTVLQATRLQHAGALDTLYEAAAQAPEPGAQVGPHGSRYRLWAPTAQAAHLCVYPGPEAPAQGLEAAQLDPATGFWQVDSPHNHHGRYYSWLVQVHAPGTGWVVNRVTDPYSVSLNADSRRSLAADLDHPKLAPPGWRGHASPATVKHNTDMVVYELHVRDFSRDDASVPAALRGRYAAFGQAHSAGMRHLRRLARAGLTDVHLLPVFDLASIPERGCTSPLPSGPPDGTQQQAQLAQLKAGDCFNWGYDPLHFNAPEGSYASDANDGFTRIREFRQMVLGLHRAGLRVGMDVVYNHTSASGQHSQSVLDRIVPGYYHRLNDDGTVANSTCCANTATEHRMMARLMVDSVRHWVRHYRIDSFRFDLMGHQPRAAMLQVQAAANAAAGRHVPLIGEGWNFGEVADGKRFVQASQTSLPGSGVATFSDRSRDAMRGGGPGDHGADLVQRKGWLSGDTRAATADLVRLGLAGTLAGLRIDTAAGGMQRGDALRYNDQAAGYVAEPGEVVNYIENHDNHTLFDALVLKLPADTHPEVRARLQLLGLAQVALSQGIAYFHAGGELMRSKSLDRNSYDSGDHFNRIDWTGQAHGFGAGLPPAWDNQRDWPQLQPLLAQAGQIRPQARHIALVRRGFEAMLRVRASSSALRLRSAEQVQQRLRFHPSGSQWVLMQIDGRGLPGARWASLVVVLNPQAQSQSLLVPALAGAGHRLHPALAGQSHLRGARLDRAGHVRVPPHSAVVWVRPHL